VLLAKLIVALYDWSNPVLGVLAKSNWNVSWQVSGAQLEFAFVALMLASKKPGGGLKLDSGVVPARTYTQMSVTLCSPATSAAVELSFHVIKI
jgi:hypothetical protein